MMPIRIGPEKSDRLAERTKGAITRLKGLLKEMGGDIHKRKRPIVVRYTIQAFLNH
jgi:hypothetical protein